MRSRDGSYAQLLSALLLTALISTSARADEYIISYRAVLHNAQLSHEKLSVSRAMTPCRGNSTSTLILNTDGHHSLRTIIQHNRSAFLEYLQTQNLHVNSSASKSNSTYRDRTTLTLSPHCFTVTINENFAIISDLK